MNVDGAPFETSDPYHTSARSDAGDASLARDAEAELTTKAFTDGAAFAAHRLRPVAMAVIAYGEYLSAVADLPAEQRAILDGLRRQAHLLLSGLSSFMAEGDGSPAEERIA